MEAEWEFHWPAYSDSPYFVRPGGSTVHLEVQNRVPYLPRRIEPTSCSSIALPASDGPPQVVDANDGPPQVVDVVEGDEQRLTRKQEAFSLPHLMTHTPYNPYCAVCRAGKSIRVQHRRGAMDQHGSRLSKLGELMTAD